ncbi:Octamer-binding transcription factor, partial [Parasponia andersonii]
SSQVMDLSPTTKTTPDTDTETPPLPQPTTSLSYNNGHHEHLYAPPQMVVSYRECRKNHAASIGGHALDGCGEFMPSDPTSLKCATCGCHRNFHIRYHPEGPTTSKRHRSSSPSPSSNPGPTPSPHSAPPDSHFASPPQIFLALSTGFSSDDHHQHTHQSLNPTVVKYSSETNPNSRKRVKTKFSQEQKEKMCFFAEKMGWKMQRRDKRLVEEFCKEVGVRRGVFQVWMYRNKRKRDRATGSHNQQPR